MMHTYIVTYCGRNGHIGKQDTIMRASDEDVIDAVGGSDHAHVIEIKDGERLVARVPRHGQCFDVGGWAS